MNNTVTVPVWVHVPLTRITPLLLLVVVGRVHTHDADVLARQQNGLALVEGRVLVLRPVVHVTLSHMETVSLFFIVVRFCRLRVVIRGWKPMTEPLRQNMQRKAGTPVPE